MSLIELKVNEMINEVDSDSPAPGGGSVSALASALGVSLSRMVGHLTISKKKFIALEEEIKKAYEENFKALLQVKNQLVPLIDADTEAFNQIMAAFKLPKETDDEKTVRNEAIEQATIGAIKVPFQVAQLSYQALTIAEKLLEHSNKNAITDIGVGALLLYSGLEGAILNVKINLGGLSDGEMIKDYKIHCQQLLTNGNQIKDQILKTVHAEIE